MRAWSWLGIAWCLRTKICRCPWSESQLRHCPILYHIRSTRIDLSKSNANSRLVDMATISKNWRIAICNQVELFKMTQFHETWGD
ncbi:hypothetical protein IWX46DRAFT_316616 [Phyllosticta citricarpa]|uniref:Secreted protein n=1 Tax=Phyllosticta citricarpa TaxID=55181 RepID=A0ABR1LIC8_9PEZI